MSIKNKRRSCSGNARWYRALLKQQKQPEFSTDNSEFRKALLWNKDYIMNFGKPIPTSSKDFETEEHCNNMLLLTELIGRLKLKRVGPLKVANNLRPFQRLYRTKGLSRTRFSRRLCIRFHSEGIEYYT